MGSSQRWLEHVLQSHVGAGGIQLRQFYCLLLADTGLGEIVDDPDDATLADLFVRPTNREASAAGYERQRLLAVGTAYDSIRNQAKVLADKIVFDELTPGERYVGMVIFEEGADDSARFKVSMAPIKPPAENAASLTLHLSGAVGDNLGAFYVNDASEVSMRIKDIEETPEGTVTAELGALAQRSDGDKPTQLLYVKTTESGNTGWLPIQAIHYGTTAQRPTSLSNVGEDIGFEFYDTTLGAPVYWTGTGWSTFRIKDVAVSPEGAVTADVGAIAQRSVVTKPTQILAVKSSGSGNTGWKTIQFVDSGTTAQRPALANAPEDIGYRYFDTTLGAQIVWSGTAWLTMRLNESAASPEASLTAGVGALVQRSGGTKPTELLYAKSSGSGNTGWRSIHPAISGTTAQRPTLANVLDDIGFRYFDTTLGIPVTWSGTAWQVTREQLLANRTYYVRTDGSDANTGLADNAGGAFLTIQKALDAAGALDLSIFDVTIQVRSGTYTNPISRYRPFVGRGSVRIVGDIATPSNVVISTTSATCITLHEGARLRLGGVKLQTTTAGHGISVLAGAGLVVDGAIEFGSVGGYYHCYVDRGATLQFTAGYTISGGAALHWDAEFNGSISAAALTINLVGTPNFTGAFARASSSGSLQVSGNTFTGSGATGQRFYASLCGAISVAGASLTYLPGSVAGSEVDGGEYA